MTYLKNTFLTVSFVLLAAQKTMALEIVWGGYLNAGFAVSDSATLYRDTEIDDRGSFGDTIFGLNMGADLGEELKLAAQLATHPGGENIEVDWAFASYRLSDTLNVAVGQLKYPGNLVSEYVDVGYLYPWIRPPQGVYSHGHSQFRTSLTLRSFRGVRLLYSNLFDSKSLGGIDYDFQFYAGAANENFITHDKLLGALATASMGQMRLLLGYNRSNLDVLENPSAPMNGKYMEMLTVGATAEWSGLVTYGEFVRSETEDVVMQDTNGGYLTLGYRFNKLLPHMTYSFFDQRSGLGQRTWTLGLRKELTSASALKIEWQRIKPKAASSESVNEIPMLEGLSGLFQSVPLEDKVDVFSIAVSILF